MGKTLKIEVTDEQSDALAAEAKASGVRFFDHCRAKLMMGLDQPAPVREAPRRHVVPVAAQVAAPTPMPDDRMDRLEAMMMQLASTVNALASHPMQAFDPAAEDEPAIAVDVDDVVTGALGEAERHGLTVVERDPAPPNAGGVRSVGPRPRSAYSAVPPHLQGLF